MNNVYNVAIIGLGQIGSYLYKEILVKKKEIQSQKVRVVYQKLPLSLRNH